MGLRAPTLKTTRFRLFGGTQAKTYCFPEIVQDLRIHLERHQDEEKRGKRKTRLNAVKQSIHVNQMGGKKKEGNSPDAFFIDGRGHQWRMAGKKKGVKQMYGPGKKGKKVGRV